MRVASGQPGAETPLPRARSDDASACPPPGVMRSVDAVSAGTSDAGREGHVADRGPREEDPTLVRNQPALRGGGRGSWLLLGGLLSAVAITVLALEVQLQPAIAVPAIVLILVLYGLMVTTAVVTRPARRRSYTLAWLMGAIALTGLLSVTAVLLAVRT